MKCNNCHFEISERKKMRCRVCHKRGCSSCMIDNHCYDCYAEVEFKRPKPYDPLKIVLTAIMIIFMIISIVSAKDTESITSNGQTITSASKIDCKRPFCEIEFNITDDVGYIDTIKIIKDNKIIKQETKAIKKGMDLYSQWIEAPLFSVFKYDIATGKTTLDPLINNSYYEADFTLDNMTETALLNITGNNISMSYTLINGLKGYWSFDDIIGSDIQDSSSNNKIGHNYNGVIVTSKVGNGIDLENSLSAYIDLNNMSNILSYSGQLTITAWVKQETPNVGRIFSIGGWDYTPNGMDFRIDSDKLFTAWKSDTNYGYGSTTLDNNYHFVAMVINGSSLAHFWIDYNKDTKATSVSASAIGNNPVSIGRGIVTAPNSSTSYFDGIIDEVGIWNRALSDNELLELHSNTNGNNPTNKTGIYRSKTFSANSSVSSFIAKFKSNDIKINISFDDGLTWINDVKSGIFYNVTTNTGDLRYEIMFNSSYSWFSNFNITSDIILSVQTLLNTGSLFSSNLSDTKNIIGEDDEFIVFANYTNLSYDPVKDATCQFSATSIFQVNEKELTSNYTVNNANSLVLNYTNIEVSINNDYDEVEFMACKIATTTNPLSIDVNGTNYQVLAVDMPTCPNIGDIRINTTVCKNKSSCLITLSGISPSIRGYIIQKGDIGFDRFFSSHTDLMNYNTTLNRYISPNQYEYYIHGLKTINVSCNKTGYDSKTSISNITVVNILPQISIDTFRTTKEGIRQFFSGITTTTKANYSDGNISISFLFPDDIIYRQFNLSYSNGSVITATTNQSFISFNLSSGTYNISILGKDSFNDYGYSKDYFIVSKCVESWNIYNTSCSASFPIIEGNFSTICSDLNSCFTYDDRPLSCGYVYSCNASNPYTISQPIEWGLTPDTSSVSGMMMLFFYAFIVVMLILLCEFMQLGIFALFITVVGVVMGFMISFTLSILWGILIGVSIIVYSLTAMIRFTMGR